jgi:hypothetical protein
MPADLTLGKGEWRLWPQAALRGPGFPADGVRSLVPAGLAAAADRFAPDSALSGPAWADFEPEFGAAAVRTAGELQRIAALPRFRAAVAWQNPALLRTCLEPFLAWTPSVAGRTSMPRQREELVAHYWQRFCVKNDTIGFFGPVGWATLDPAEPGVTVHPGTGLVETSAVYFSSWAIDAAAKAISADPGLRGWLPPRRVTFVRVDAHAVHVPGRPPQPVDPLRRAVLLCCDGVAQPAEIAARVSATLDRELPLPELLDLLTELAKARWISWRIEVPADAHPERELRAILDRVGDPEVRERALAELDVLVGDRDRIAAAGQDAPALIAAFTALEQDFAALTATAAQREKGARTAPCRAIVYSDTRRAATAVIGRAVLDELAPIGLCLTAARWLTNRFAAALAGHLRAAHDRVLARDGVVALGALWFECLPAPHPAAAAELDAIVTELRARWSAIIGGSPDARLVQLASADITDQVRAAFDEPGRGWATSRYVSPDVVIAATDAAAVARGEFQLVLGELHVAINTMGASLFVRQHPDPESLIAETSTDFPGPRLLPMLPKEQPPRWSARSKPSLVRPADYYVGLVDHTADPHRPRTYPSAAVTVRPRGDRLVVELPDGAEFDVLDVFGNALTNQVMDRFSLRADAPHSPRVVVDRLVIAREQWRFPLTAMPFATERSEARRFVRARWWRRANGLPRHVFVTSPVESRPFYVDFDSPVLVGLLAKSARRLDRAGGGELRVVEMLPTPDQTWLTDDQGARYTAEIRLVAVDQTGPDTGIGAP